jgi:hypothetical protein
MIRWLFKILLSQRAQEFLKKYVYEWLLTFSNKPSFFSSKRLERAFLINTALILICFYVYHTRNELTAFEFMVIITPLFGYAGFNTVRISKDSNDGKSINIEQSTETTNETTIEEPKS